MAMNFLKFFWAAFFPAKGLFGKGELGWKEKERGENCRGRIFLQVPIKYLQSRKKKVRERKA